MISLYESLLDDFDCTSCGGDFSEIDVEKICKVGGHIIIME